MIGQPKWTAEIHNECPLERVTVSKYQEVKEFHMLARIDVIVKLWLSVLSNLKSYIIIHPRGTNDYAPSNL